MAEVISRAEIMDIGLMVNREKVGPKGIDFHQIKGGEGGGLRG